MSAYDRSYMPQFDFIDGIPDISFERVSLWNTSIALPMSENEEHKAARQWSRYDHFPLWLYWAVYDSVHQFNIQNASLLAIFGMFIDRESNRNTSDIVQAQYAIAWLLDEIAETPTGVRLEKDPMERLLRFTYLMLRRKQLTHAQTAMFVSEWLGEHVSANAWRKRVDRWAKRKGLPPVEQRKHSRKQE